MYDKKSEEIEHTKVIISDFQCDLKEIPPFFFEFKLLLINQNKKPIKIREVIRFIGLYYLRIKKLEKI